MASFHTSITETITPGEKFIYNLLDKYLDSEFQIWSNLNFGNEIDFFIIHNDLGILLLEVKDWSISNIHNVTSHEVKGSFYNNKVTTETNPIKKGKEIGHNVQNKLQKIKELVHTNGRYQNKLKVPVNAITVFTNIETTELKDRNFLGESKFDPGKIITKTDLEFAYGEGFIELLFEKRDIVFDTILRPEEMEIIISELGTNSGVNDIVTHKLEGILDAHQEKLANSKLDQNLIIEGPAGSGKTIVLIKRLQNYLKIHPQHKVGVFSFNAVLANYLKTYINQEIKENYLIDIYNFDSYTADFSPKYNLILVDEAQDIKPSHYNLIFKLLKGDGKVNLFFDKRQTIYTSTNLIEGFANKGLGKFEEEDLLLQKRSPILQTAIAYYEAIKNPQEPLKAILELTEKITWRMFFSKKMFNSALNWLSKKLGLNVQNAEEAKSGMRSMGSEGITPILEPSIEQILDSIALDIKDKVENNECNYYQFMILHPLFYDRSSKFDFKKIIRDKFRHYQIPFELNHNRYGCDFDGKTLRNLEDNRSTFDFLRNRVRIFELFHCKGLDADYVYVVDFDKIGEHSRNSDLTVYHNREGEYAYVCLTRAKKEIKLFSRSSYYSHKMLKNILQAQNSESTVKA